MAPDPAWLPTTSYAILGLLSFGRELSGYDVKKWADHSLRFFFWSPAISNIYGELKRLQGLGYVQAHEVPQDELRNKRLFRITPAGIDALAAWIGGAPVEPPVLKEHAVLRVWLGHVAGKDRLLEIVQAEEAAARRLIGEIERDVAASRRDAAFSYASVVEEWCLRYQSARAEAFAELRQALHSLPAAKPRTRRRPASQPLG